MDKPTCSIIDCDRPAAARTWCRMHYKRWYYGGDPLIGRSSPPPKPSSRPRITGEGTTCSKQDCPAPVLASQLCVSHYQRMRYGKRKALAPSTRACQRCEEVKPDSDFPSIAARVCAQCHASKQPRVRRPWHPERRGPMEHRVCAQCGTDFLVVRRQRHCSQACADAAKNADNVKNVAVRRARQARVVTESFHKQDIFDRDGWTCQLCGEPIDRTLAWPDPGSVSLDHIVPISLGGAHTRDNTAAAHLFCNLSKHNRVA